MIYGYQEMTESKGRALRGDFLIATSSLPGSKRCRWLHYAIMPFLCQALKGERITTRNIRSALNYRSPLRNCAYLTT